MLKRTIILIIIVGMVIIGMGSAKARDQVRIVGSSTVFPFATAVAERFGKTTQYKAPVVESTGSGGGLKLFCVGIGVKYPDIANTSRAIKKSEIEKCREAGVNNITEIKIGYDGIIMANSRQMPIMNISRKQLFLALAKDIPNPDGSPTLIPNPYKMWSDIHMTLPSIKIEILGPPPTSGTRDAFTELALEAGCQEFTFIKTMKKKDTEKYKAICHTVREDGFYIEVGENDNLIVQKLETNPDIFGLFGFSFLDQNIDRIQGSAVEGYEPTFENITAKKYPISRPLYLYVKDAHIGKIPGFGEYLVEFTSDKAWGEEGYLIDKGLIPMSTKERNKYKKNVVRLMSNARML